MVKAFCVLVLCAFCSSAIARMPILASPCLTWQDPTQREDGTPLPRAEIKGYVIRWVRTNSAKNTESVGSIRTGNKACYNLAYRGDYQFFIKTVDIADKESTWSAPLNWKL